MDVESPSVQINRLIGETRNMALDILCLQGRGRFVGKPEDVKRFRERLDVAAAHARKFLRGGL